MGLMILRLMGSSSLIDYHLTSAFRYRLGQPIRTPSGLFPQVCGVHVNLPSQHPNQAGTVSNSNQLRIQSALNYRSGTKPWPGVESVPLAQKQSEKVVFQKQEQRETSKWHPKFSAHTLVISKKKHSFTLLIQPTEYVYSPTVLNCRYTEYVYSPTISNCRYTEYLYSLLFYIVDIQNICIPLLFYIIDTQNLCIRVE